jgi:aminomuconate-semialdehyde/2-hydroxymuconate-6-semialdehyde dehydrogenase
VEHLANYIDGLAVPAKGGGTIEVFEPATGRAYALLPDSGAGDVEAAIDAAERAFPAWSGASVETRSRCLLRLADLIDQHADELARAESIDTGKPIALARAVDIPRSAANLRFFATAILHTQTACHEFDGSGTPGGERALNFTLRRPRGVAGLISPWNLPLYLLTWKIAPAITTGNTCVCKPSEVTPATASMLGGLCTLAGLPAGVLNIVHGRGDGAGAALVTSPRVPTVSFTGSTRVGQWIAREAGPKLKRLSLELGGKNAAMVFADADMPATLDTLARASFTNSGQICLCASRILVHESRFEQVLEGLVERAKAWRAGDPLEPSTRHGAVASRAHLEKIDAAVKAARGLGAKVHCGGGVIGADELPSRCRGGWFFAPTVLSGLDAACSVEQEEIFGPVVSVSPFRDEAEAVARANSTGYGLASMVYTQDLARAHRVAARMQSGLVWVNCWLVRDLRTPFGGMKQSGLGREGGTDALHFFTEPSNVCIRVDQF